MGSLSTMVEPHTFVVKELGNGDSDGKESACNAGDVGSVPGSGWSSGEGNGNPLQHSCLENSMDREAWWATIHGVMKLDTDEWLTHTQTQWSPQECGLTDCSPAEVMEEMIYYHIWRLPGDLVARTLCSHSWGYGFKHWGTKISYAVRCSQKKKKKWY